MKRSVKYLKILCNFLNACLILFLLFYVLPKTIVFFMPFVVGAVFAMVANPVVKFLEKHIRIKRKYGSVLMIILVIAGIVLLCQGAIGLLGKGLKSFSESLPTLYQSAETEVSNAVDSLEHFLNELPFVTNLDFEKYKEMAQQLMEGLMSDSGGETVDRLGNVAKKIPNLFVSVIMGLLATYFFIVDRDKLHRLAVQHTPESLLKKGRRLYEQIIVAVGGYFKAQFQIMLVVYLILLAGLMILGIQYAWLIGFGIAFLDMLPIFGTGTVLLPWALVKLFSGNYMVSLGMLALYGICLVAHQLLQPKLVGDSVGMDPFATLFFMYIGYRVKGVLGMVIAIPAGMVLMNMYKAGTFDSLLWCVKELVADFNAFRHVG